MDAEQVEPKPNAVEQAVLEEVKRKLKAVDERITQTKQVEKIKDLEEEIKYLEEEYRDNNQYSDSVRIFCYSKRSYLQLYKQVFTPENRSLQPVTQEVKTVMNDVDGRIKKAERRTRGEQREEMQEVLQKITDMELKCIWTEEYYRNVTRFCDIKRAELEFCRKIYGTQEETLQIRKVEEEMDAVDDLIQKVLHTPPEERQEGPLEEAKRKILKNPVLGWYSLNKGDELDVCREIYVTQKRSQQPGTGEVINEIKAVYELIREYKHRPAVEVEKKIDDLEKKSRDDSEYYSSVKSLWNKKRTDLELCSRLGLLELEFNSSNTEK
ncbi:17-beta-hydroxysteroid dehydrogenase 14, partial [Clarias magur]